MQFIPFRKGDYRGILNVKIPPTPFLKGGLEIIINKIKMQITKNWFYKLSDLFSLPLKSKEVPEGGWIFEIIIEDNLIVSFFDDLNKSYNISIWENSKVEIFSVLENSEDFKLKILQEKENSDLKLNYLILSQNDDKVSAKIESVLKADFVKSNVKIISIVWNNWAVDLDWIIKIEEGIKKVDWNLSEENIFLWDNWSVKWIPTLLVSSSDVKASHSCKMERISDEKLFYLRSRWLWRDNALNMIIEAKIENLFSCLRMYDKNFYEKTLESILVKI